MNDAKPRRLRALPIYLLLAYGITWACWIPALLLAAREGYLMPGLETYGTLLRDGFVDARHRWLAILFQAGVYGPLIGGVVAISLENGRSGLRDLWSRLARWQVGRQWYLTAISITFLLTATPVAFFIFTGSFTLSPLPIGIVLFALAVQLLTSGLGEEPGWRGYLLPRLQERLKGEQPVWVLGTFWAVWHYPLVVLQVLAVVQGVNAAQLLITVVLALAGQTMSLIGLTYIYIWLYNRTGSLLLVIMFHALSNLFNGWIPTFLIDPQMVGMLPALMPWVVVILLQRKFGKDEFPGRPLLR